MPTNKLTAQAVEKAKPKPRPYRLADGNGMFLEIRTGSDGKAARYWRMAYRHGGKQKQLALGVYPGVTLAEAREARDAAHKLLRAGVDPSAEKRAQKATAAGEDKFATVADAWYTLHRDGTRDHAAWSDRYAARVRSLLDNDLLPALGELPVATIKPKDIIPALKRIEARGALNQVARARKLAEAVLAYAVGIGLAETNPAAVIPQAVFASRPVKHHAAVTDPDQVKALLLAIRGYSGHATVRAALRLLPLVFVRPGELRNATWAEFDLDGGTWEIPAGRMKMRKPHTVPLSRQAVAILRELHSATGDGDLVFPGVWSSDKPISDNTLNAALRGLGYDKDTQSAHGFRAIARTLLDERLHERPDLIEHQLAHTVRDPLGRAYNRTSHLAERRAMMQRWADYLDRLCDGGKADVVQRSRKRGK